MFSSRIISSSKSKCFDLDHGDSWEFKGGHTWNAQQFSLLSPCHGYSETFRIWPKWYYIEIESSFIIPTILFLWSWILWGDLHLFKIMYYKIDCVCVCVCAQFFNISRDLCNYNYVIQRNCLMVVFCSQILSIPWQPTTDLLSGSFYSFVFLPFVVLSFL